MTDRRHDAGAARVVAVLGVAQILAWGSTYYLPAVLAAPIAADTGWSLTWIVAALSLGTLTSGLAAPRVGRLIDRYGGRPVLAASAVSFACGLAGLALAPNLAAYFVSWAVLGLGMAAGLYDAAFGTLGRLYGQDARPRITVLTLFGGFASTVCWPLSAWLVAHLGWRGTCVAYALLHLCLLVPGYLLLLPRHDTVPRTPTLATAPARTDGVRLLPFVLLALSGALTAAVGAIVAVHLLTMLTSRGIEVVAAVALGALVGPAQVGARLVEMLLGRFHHPLWTMLAAALLMTAGTGLLYAGAFLPAVALVLYGAGMGIHSIARGTVPLAIFGAERYATLMGRLARPSAIVGALAPTLVAMLWEASGMDAALLTLVAAAVANLIVVSGLTIDWRRRHTPAKTSDHRSRASS